MRTTLVNLEPHVIKFGQTIQIQWNILLKYVEGPVYDKTIEIAEQVRRNLFESTNKTIDLFNS